MSAPFLPNHGGDEAIDAAAAAAREHDDAAAVDDLEGSILSFTAGIDMSAEAGYDGADEEDASEPVEPWEPLGTPTLPARPSPEQVAAGTPTPPPPHSPISVASVGVGTVVRGVPYCAGGRADDKRRLDIYFPGGLHDAAQAASAKRRPLVIHVHGGGWVRGDRSIGFYGCPSMSNGYAHKGFVAVAPSYRLGQYPLFLLDVIDAVLFATTAGNLERASAGAVGVKPVHLEVLAAQVRNGVVFSGHSAGAHIISTIATVGARLSCLQSEALRGAREALKELLRPSHVKGILLLSGIYTPRNPFSPNGPSNWKTSVFNKLYMEKAFTPFGADLDELSPAWHLANYTRGSGPAVAAFCKSVGLASLAPLSGAGAAEGSAEPPLLRFPCAVFSAACDLGLEQDAERFVNLIVEARRCAMSRDGSDADGHLDLTISRITIPNTSHASICMKPEAHVAFSDVLRRILNPTLMPAAERSP